MTNALQDFVTSFNGSHFGDPWPRPRAVIDIPEGIDVDEQEIHINHDGQKFKVTRAILFEPITE